LQKFKASGSEGKTPKRVTFLKDLNLSRHRSEEISKTKQQTGGGSKEVRAGRKKDLECYAVQGRKSCQSQDFAVGRQKRKKKMWGGEKGWKEQQSFLY